MGIKRNKLAMTEKEKHIERSKSSLKNFLEEANITQDSETARILDSLLTQYQYPYIKQWDPYIPKDSPRYSPDVQVTYFDKHGNEISKGPPRKDPSSIYPKGGSRASFDHNPTHARLWKWPGHEIEYDGFPIDTTHVGIGNIRELLAELAHAGQWSTSNGKQVPWDELKDFRIAIGKKSNKEKRIHGKEGVYDVEGTMEHDAHSGDYEWSEPILVNLVKQAQKKDRIKEKNAEFWNKLHKEREAAKMLKNLKLGKRWIEGNNSKNVSN